MNHLIESLTNQTNKLSIPSHTYPYLSIPIHTYPYLGAVKILDSTPKPTRGPADLADAGDQLWDEGLQDRVQLDAMGLIPSDRYMILCKARYYMCICYSLCVYMIPYGKLNRYDTA